jgi:hypothetical protein
MPVGRMNSNVIIKNQQGGKCLVKSIEIISNDRGEKIVYINDVCFKSRRTLDWLEIEKLLKKERLTQEESLKTLKLIDFYLQNKTEVKLKSLLEFISVYDL